jgi:hypothetical protein
MRHPIVLLSTTGESSVPPTWVSTGHMNEAVLQGGRWRQCGALLGPQCLKQHAKECRSETLGGAGRPALYGPHHVIYSEGRD